MSDVRCPPEPPVRHGFIARTRVPHTSAEVIAALKAQRGITMSAPYLSQLRSGAGCEPIGRPWPLANFFRIKAACFTDDEVLRKIDKELRVAVHDAHDDGVPDGGPRASGSRRCWTEIDELRRAEGIGRLVPDTDRAPPAWRVGWSAPRLPQRSPR